MDSKALTTPTALDLPLDSAALRRLIDEVAGGQHSAMRGYNRTHNRHNR
ncbi:hypothetical protein HL653_21580 [Sphingomonas sp. AP4-R1]|nr:YhhA family cyclophane-containing RiPP [Sphingomonas sp. AP4-R1]QJU59988.1 hypothetical protein HL653_21580 [Sphingomonas sp. AP4-R1]